MKLATFRKMGTGEQGRVSPDAARQAAAQSVEQGTSVGLVVAGGLVDIAAAVPGAPRDMVALLAAWPRFEAALRSAEKTAPTHALGDVELLAPVPRPGKTMAIGLNYADHIAESGQPTPTEQVWFAKMGTSVHGPFAPIQLPRVSPFLDYEAELVVVIGRRCRHVSREEAPAAVFGYMAGNDVTVRDWQFRTPQWTLGKSFDTHAPMGPWIVTADEVGDPHDLGIRCFVNGEKRQDSNTCHLVFDVWDQIVHLSQAMTLEPGDVVFTGTPGGVGALMEPRRFLAAGDMVRVEIDRVGAIEASVEEE